MDRDELLSAMYTSDGETETVSPVERSGLRTRKIRVGIVEYEVPTIEYVQHLEQLVTQQASLLTQQRRAIDRINAMLHGTRDFVRRQTDNIVDIRQELTRKLDVRQ